MEHDLELEITSGGVPGVYAVAVDSPAGAAAGTVRLDVGGLLSRRRELAASVLASAVTTRAGLSSALEGPVREVGEALFAAVFAERVYGRYTASVQEAARCGEPLRVVLRLRAPELAALPWETLFDPETDEYLCQRDPVVRYVETAQPANPLTVDSPLRILGVIAAPRDLPRLDVTEEQRRLTDALADLTRRRQVELVWAPGGSWPVLQQQLLAGPWHVVHFIGHSGADSTAGNGQLALENETTGQAALVSAGRFARLLHTCRPVPQLVVLNSCQSGEAAPDDLLSSTAAALVHSGVSGAVAMQFAVTDAAALAFARGFYQALATNNPVDEAVRVGRIAIDGTSEHTLEWVTPVLYLRTDDTRLFAVQATSGPAPATSAGQPSTSFSETATTRSPDAVSFPRLVRTLTGHTGVITNAHGVAFSPDGRQLASCGRDKTVRLWDPATGTQQRILTGHTGGVHGVAFSPDGRQLASCGNDKTVRPWDPATGTQQCTLTGHKRSLAAWYAAVMGVAFSPDGRLLASCGTDCTVQLWDPVTGEHQRTLGYTTLDVVRGVAFSPDGRLLASCGDDKAVRLWDPATGAQRILTGHTSWVRGVAFSPDRQLLASCGDDMVRLWDLTPADT